MAQDNILQGVVLAGVHRWNRDSFEESLPRPLMDIAHSPLISYVLRWFHQGGIHRVTICANSASRAMRCLLSDGSQLGMNLDYFEDEIPRGPAGCIHDAARERGGGIRVVTEGAIIPRVDLASVLETHMRSSAALTVVVEPDKLGGPASRLMSPAGIYVMQDSILRHVRDTGYQDIKEGLLPKLYEAGDRVATHTTANCASLRVTGPETYLQANAWALETLCRDERIIAGYRTRGEARVHETAEISPAARLIGPVLIGPRSRICRDAVLIGPVVLGADCVVESEAAVCRSVLWDRCRIGRGGFVDRCVVTRNVEVEPGRQLRRKTVMGGSSEIEDDPNMETPAQPPDPPHPIEQPNITRLEDPDLEPELVSSER